MVITKSKPLFFPHPYHTNDHGILAIGGEVCPETLIMSYSAGIFPWNHEDDMTLWWFTFPRMILHPSQVKISKSMRQVIRQEKYRVTMNTNFSGVIDQCQKIPRKGQDGTWLYDKLKETMHELHNQGYAHSVEVWDGDDLVGGLYGISIGKIFCGESMFALKSNASKLALIHLCAVLTSHDFKLIDCQQETDHLVSMGAETMGAGTFLEELRFNALEDRLYLHKCLSTS